MRAAWGRLDEVCVFSSAGRELHKPHTLAGNSTRVEVCQHRLCILSSILAVVGIYLVLMNLDYSIFSCIFGGDLTSNVNLVFFIFKTQFFTFLNVFTSTTRAHSNS